MNYPGLNANVSDKRASEPFMQWMQEFITKRLGKAIITNDAVCPQIPQGGTILWHSTTLDKMYVVHWDGTHKYFWEATGVDLY